MPGRLVGESHMHALTAVLDKAHGLTARDKIVGAVGTVVSTVLVVSGAMLCVGRSFKCVGRRWEA